MGQANQIFNAEFVSDQVFFTFTSQDLDKEMLFVQHPHRQYLVQWTRINDHIYLEAVPVKSKIGNIIPINGNSRIEKLILASFPISEYDENKDFFKINVTELFLSTEIYYPKYVTENIVRNQSYIQDLNILNDEIIISTQRTSSFNNEPFTENVVFSFLSLGAPMKPRNYDHRFGFKKEDDWTVHSLTPKSFPSSILKRNLEKVNLEDEISNPKKPIIYYLDPRIPEKWLPYIKAGVLAWEGPLKKAGYKNIFVFKEIPKKDNWPANSVKYSVIRWINNRGYRGSEEWGGSTVNLVYDPRSGEILKSDILLTAPFQSLSEQYILRCAPLDVRAQTYPLPDDLMGQLLQFITTHEAGHTLGIGDDNFGEYAYSIDNIRDKGWLETMGHTPSIMSYARHNNIAQPEDSIPPDLLIQKIGPMDDYQIKWAYSSFKNEHDLNSFLKNEVLKQDSMPWLRYHHRYFELLGPQYSNEVVESNDPVKAAKLALDNLKKTTQLLPSITINEPDNDALLRLRKKSLQLWYNQMDQVISLLGGYSVQYKSGSQNGDVYAPISKQKQLDALNFLIDNVIHVQDWLSSPRFILRINYTTGEDELLDYQIKLLKEIFNPYRLKRMEHQEIFSTNRELTKEFLFKLGNGLFTDSTDDSIASRRIFELQKEYIVLLLEGRNQEKNYEQVNVGGMIYSNSEYTKSIIDLELKNRKEYIEKKIESLEPGLEKQHYLSCVQLLSKEMGCVGHQK